jgi:hypothetical protein
MIIDCSTFKIICDEPIIYQRWLPLLKIEMFMDAKWSSDLQRWLEFLWVELLGRNEDMYCIKLGNIIWGFIKHIWLWFPVRWLDKAHKIVSFSPMVGLST